MMPAEMARDERMDVEDIMVLMRSELHTNKIQGSAERRGAEAGNHDVVNGPGVQERDARVPTCRFLITFLAPMPLALCSTFRTRASAHDLAAACGRMPL